MIQLHLVLVFLPISSMLTYVIARRYRSLYHGMLPGNFDTAIVALHIERSNLYAILQHQHVSLRVKGYAARPGEVIYHNSRRESFCYNWRCIFGTTCNRRAVIWRKRKSADKANEEKNHNHRQTWMMDTVNGGRSAVHLKTEE
jgi:hypothetical protein